MVWEEGNCPIEVSPSADHIASPNPRYGPIGPDLWAVGVEVEGASQIIDSLRILATTLPELCPHRESLNASFRLLGKVQVGKGTFQIAERHSRLGTSHERWRISATIARFQADSSVKAGEAAPRVAEFKASTTKGGMVNGVPGVQLDCALIRVPRSSSISELSEDFPSLVVCGGVLRSDLQPRTNVLERSRIVMQGQSQLCALRTQVRGPWGLSDLKAKCFDPRPGDRPL